MKLRLLSPSAYLLSLLSLGVTGCVAKIKMPAAPAASINAVFDPLASPSPEIPLPNDLVKNGGDGVHLNVPDAPTDSPAQVDFNHYLNTLDGFPSSTPGSFSFSAAIDPTTLTIGTPTIAGSVVVFDTTAPGPLGPSDYALSLGADGQSVTITPTKRWISAHQYVVAIFGGADANGVKGATGETVLASPAFFFLRSPNPVEGLCDNGTTPGCACPANVVAKADPSDTTCHSVVTGLPDAEARLLESGRQQLSVALDTLLPLAGPEPSPRSRSDVVLFWNFSVASAPMGVFDPVRGDVPFPNDVLIDQTTQLVKVPIASPDPEAAEKMGLNLLDGFSVTAPETLDIDSAADIDPATVISGNSAVLLGVTSALPPSYSAAPVLVNNGMTFAGQIEIVPTHALESEQTRYAAIFTTDVQDKMGRALAPPPTMVLIRGKNPLVDASGHSTVPSVLGDSDAQQLEVLRLSDAPLFDAIETDLMVPRDKVASAWTFTTESIMRPLAALDELPTTANLTTDVVFQAYDATAVGAAALPFPTSHMGGIVLGSMITQRVEDPTTGTMSFARDTLDSTARFTATVPATAKVESVRFALTLPASPSPAPVVILQHGFTSWRGDMAPLADDYAAAGIATIMIDMPFHGARTICSSDKDCASGAAGSCSTTTGQCAGGLAITPLSDNPMACAFKGLSGDNIDCEPVASGAAFLNANNLFASRDNIRQFVVDAAQLIRVLADQTNASGLHAQLVGAGAVTVDATKLSYLGFSLGGIAGSVFLSVAPQPLVGVLNVTGGHLFDVVATGSFSSLLQPLLTSLMITPDTPAYLQLANTARWILDPVDPFAVGQHLVRQPIASYLTGSNNAPKVLLQQEAGMDTTIQPVLQSQLAVEIFGASGVDASGHAQAQTTGGATVSSYFPTAVHTSLIAVPSTSTTMSERAQALGWISSSGATLSSP